MTPSMLFPYLAALFFATPMSCDLQSWYTVLGSCGNPVHQGVGSKPGHADHVTNHGGQ